MKIVNPEAIGNPDLNPVVEFDADEAEALRQLTVGAIPPPRPTGKRGELYLDGMLVPWDGDRPVLLQILGGNVAVAAFSTQEKLEHAMATFGIGYTSVKKIDEGREFLESVQQGGVQVIVDPWKTQEGKVRYLETRLPDEEQS